MKIKSLTVENFKRIKTVHIETAGTTIRICGRNAQGKSSTLDAIAAAFGGKTSCPDRAIREGETRARILSEGPMSKPALPVILCCVAPNWGPKHASQREGVPDAV